LIAHSRHSLLSSPCVSAAIRLLTRAVRPHAAATRRVPMHHVALMTAATTLKFGPPPAEAPPPAVKVLIGRKAALLSHPLPEGVPDAVWKALVSNAKPGDDGDSASTTVVNADGQCSTVVAAVLPEACSRHNSPVRPHAISKLAAAASGGVSKPGGAAIVCVLDSPEHAAPAACAIARSFPLFSAKKGGGPDAGAEVAEAEPTVHVSFATEAAGH